MCLLTVEILSLHLIFLQKKILVITVKTVTTGKISRLLREQSTIPLTKDSRNQIRFVRPYLCLVR